MGKVEQNIIMQAIRSGNPIPDRIQNAPELTLGLYLFLSAWFDLDSERTVANGVMPIPWSSIMDYARAFRFDSEQTEDLLYFVKRMDRAYLDRINERKDG